MWKRFYIFPVVLTCTIILNGHDASPPSPSIDFPSLSNAVNFPSTSAASGSSSYPTTATSSQTLFPNGGTSEKNLKTVNVFPTSSNADSTNPIPDLVSQVFPSVISLNSVSTSFSPSPEFATSIPNSNFASATSASDVNLAIVISDTNCAESNPASLPTDPPSDTPSLNPFAKSALSLPSLQKYLDLQISGIEASILFYKIAYEILIDYANPTPEYFADEIAQAVTKIEVLTLPLYFQAMGNAVEDFFLLKGVEVTPLLPITYSLIVDYYVTSPNVNNAETLYKSLADALVRFITASGFRIEIEADNWAHFFSSELIAVAQ